MSIKKKQVVLKCFCVVVFNLLTYFWYLKDYESVIYYNKVWAWKLSGIFGPTCAVTKKIGLIWHLKNVYTLKRKPKHCKIL